MCLPKKSANSALLFRVQIMSYKTNKAHYWYHRLDAQQMRFLGPIAGTTLRQHMRNKTIREEVSSTNILCLKGDGIARSV
jgi:hypothetical protein